MVNSQILRRKYDSDADYDPASLLDTRVEERPRYSKSGWRGADPDTARGLAWRFSESLPPNKWGSPVRLDLAELKNLTKYMGCLLEEHALSPDQIRGMVAAYAELTRDQTVSYPVGKFWAMRRVLMEKATPPREKSYEGWLQPNIQPAGLAKSYLGWAK